MTSSHSDVVKNGMKRLCKDFNEIIIENGFNKTGHRRWKRERDDYLEQVHLWRNGSSYGAPSTNSIDIRVNLSSKNLASDSGSEVNDTSSDYIRKQDGYVYHLRFNAKSWSTYDLCLDELNLFIQDYAEPWFNTQKKPVGSMAFLRKLFKGKS